MKTYLDFLATIRHHGSPKKDRTGTGTWSIFGYEMRFHLSDGFPLVTTKKVHTKSIFSELLWFLRGDTNIHYLHEQEVTIWDEWADKAGNLGPVYGKQWRSWETTEGRTIDQMQWLLREIKTNPDSRRLIVSAWNVGDLNKMALPPCHLLMQFYVTNGQLSCKLTQRSADAFLGVPFNIASYALLTHLIAQQCELTVGDLIWSGGDCHIYTNHLAQVDLQLSRSPFPLSQLKIKRKAPSLFEYQLDDIEVTGYESHAAIKASVAV